MTPARAVVRCDGLAAVGGAGLIGNQESSRAIGERRHNMGKEYFEKLKDPRWQKLRLQVLERDEWACTICGSSSDTLHVHHGHYKSKFDPWEYDPQTLHTVCESCHDHADCIRVDLQFEIAKLPLRAQELLLHFANWLNCISGENAIELLRSDAMPNIQESMEIDAFLSQQGR